MNSPVRELSIVLLVLLAGCSGMAIQNEPVEPPADAKPATTTTPETVDVRFYTAYECDSNATLYLTERGDNDTVIQSITSNGEFVFTDLPVGESYSLWAEDGNETRLVGPYTVTGETEVRIDNRDSGWCWAN